MLDVRRVAVLVAVADHGSLTAAARVLGYTQPAMSHHIRRLEVELGGALIERHPRGVRLTPAGTALAEYGRVALTQLDNAERRARAALAGAAERVSIAAFPSAIATLVADALARLHAARPGLEVVFVEREPLEALADLRSGDVDVAVVFEYEEGPLPVDDAFDRLPLHEDHLVAVLPLDHPAATLGAVSLSMLASERWVAGCPRCRRQLVHACHAYDFEPEVVMATDDYVAVQRIVASGVAVSVLPAMALRAARRADVAVRELVDPQRRNILALNRAATRTAGVSSVLSALDEATVAAR